MDPLPPALPDCVLIANRGEIAIRIARTCRDLGIRTLAVHSAADAGAVHVAACDAAVELSGARPGDGYLDAAQIIAAATAHGAAAIHPGYGFLAENAAFARDCRAAGLVFIGPSSEAIERLGDKIAAKHIAQAAGVPVVPGFADDDAGEPGDRDARLLAAAADLAYPLLIKASAGGGGRGMRIVESPAELDQAIDLARQEAAAAFANDRLLVERYIARPRHVEVQIFGDRHGNVIHLHERDCSLQRRHQKLVEEAPAPGLHPQTRSALHEAALAVAKAVAYDNAGTVEFVLDADTQEFFFLEVNTRLQVEHPVTEALFGVDLVDWQLRVAAGQLLPLAQADLQPVGWAIEARLVAEDADQGFLPQTGTIAYIVPPRGHGIRFDSGIAPGQAVTPYYDSMLAKVIAHAPDRTTAMHCLDRALAASSVMGVETNLAFLRDVLHDATFAAGEHTTHLLQRPLTPTAPDNYAELSFAAAAIAAVLPGPQPADSSPWASLGAWRGGGAAPWQARTPCVLLDDEGRRHARWLRLADATATIEAMDDDDASPLQLDYQTGRGEISIRQGAATLAFRTHVERAADGVGRDIHVDAGHGAWCFRHIDGLAAWRRQSDREAGDESAVRAPGPGMVISVAVAEGDRVEAGAELLVIESMKMLQTLTAPLAGTVGRIHCQAGQSIVKSTLLLQLEAAAVPEEC